MILRRLYDDKLAQASYLLGCAATGEALVVDPSRDVRKCLEEAAREGLRVTHVAETHIHADFVSGARELAARTGARLHLSAEGGEEWSYAYAAEAGATLLAGGDAFHVGKVRVEALHTPGHTPEHLAYLVTDEAGADRPMGCFTGDFVFVGDVGRPDLLERAVGREGTMAQAARRLFRSIQEFKAHPDYLQLWPAHGAGSACGKALGAVPQTTLGYERLFNWAFAVGDENEFVEQVLAGQPDPPRYFATMKRVNREGPALMRDRRPPPRLAGSALASALESGALVVDARPAARHATARVPGTLNIPLSKTFPIWAGWLLPYDRDLHLILEDGDGGQVLEASRDLLGIGLDRVVGWFGPDAVDAWSAAGRGLETVRRITPADLGQRLRAGGTTVLDVRNPGEWDHGHIADALHIPLGHLQERLAEVPKDGEIVVHCQSGARSAIAASLLMGHGFTEVANVEGGFAAWEAAGQPIVREGEPRAA